VLAYGNDRVQFLRLENMAPRRHTDQNPTLASSSTTKSAPLAVLALGGNQGELEVWFRRAIRSFSQHLTGVEVAPLYRSEPISSISQPHFLNTVFLGTTTLIAKCLEHAAGRRRGPRLGPRPLDIDILLYGDSVSENVELRLPHPHLARRRFVLQPLVDLRPQLVLPTTRHTAQEMLAELPEAPCVWRV